MNDRAKDNPSLQDQIKALEGLAAERMATLKESIGLRQRSERNLRRYVQLINKGKEQMDGIRALVAAMQVAERGNLAERQRQTLASYRAAVTTGLATAVLGLVMVGAFVWLLVRNLRIRQKAAAVVQEQREWFRTTLSSIGDAVIATDAEGRVTFLNAVAEALTGWTPDEARASRSKPCSGSSTRGPARPSRTRPSECSGRASRRGGEPHTAHRPGWDRAADRRQCRTDPRREGPYRRGRPDFPRHHRAEAAGEGTPGRADELADADRRKDEFLAMLAHELRNPLAPIRNALQILRARAAATAAAPEATEIMERQVRHMVRLVDDLLDVSRISRGKIELRQEPRRRWRTWSPAPSRPAGR